MAFMGPREDAQFIESKIENLLDQLRPISFYDSDLGMTCSCCYTSGVENLYWLPTHRGPDGHYLAWEWEAGRAEPLTSLQQEQNDADRANFWGIPLGRTNVKYIHHCDCMMGDILCHTCAYDIAGTIAEAALVEEHERFGMNI